MIFKTGALFLGHSVFSSDIEGGGKGGVAVFSAKRWDRRSRETLIESTTTYYDAQMLQYGPNRPFSSSAKEPESSGIFMHFYARGSTEWL